MHTVVRCTASAGSGQTAPAPARAAVLVRRRAALALAAAPLAVFAAMPASAASDGGPLLAAASLGDVAMLSAALAGGAAVESKNKVGNTALHEASRSGRVECVRLLLEKGAAIEALGVNGVTPLICASGSDSPATVSLLLDAGASVNAVSSQGTSALMYAAMKGRPECAKLLLAKGADAKLKSGQGFTALHFAASGPSDAGDAAHADGYPAVASLLLAVKGVDVDAQDNDGWTPVYCAAAAGQTATLKLLLQHGADFSKPDAGTGAMPMGATPLHQACAGRHADCVKELLVAGADEYAQDKLGRTPIDALPDTGISDERYQACVYWLGQAKEIDGTAAGQLGRLLKDESTLDVQAALSFFDKSKGKAALDINAQMKRLYSRTALNLVALNKSNPKWTQLVGGLIALGADVNLVNDDETPLFSAAYNGNTEVVRLLLDAGAAINWTRGGTYDQGYTPLMTALYHGYEDTALALLDKGAATDTQLPPVDGDPGFMPLHLAIKEAKSLAVTKAIIERGGPGADVYARAGRGGFSTPLELAELAAYSSGNSSVFDYLKSVAPPPPPAKPSAGCVIC